MAPPDLFLALYCPVIVSVKCNKLCEAAPDWAASSHNNVDVVKYNLE